MNGARIGDGPWGCLVVFAIIGVIAAVYALICLITWLINHVSIN